MLKIAGGVVALFAGITTLGLWLQAKLFPYQEKDREVFDLFFEPALWYGGVFVIFLILLLLLFIWFIAQRITYNNINLIKSIEIIESSNEEINKRVESIENLTNFLTNSSESLKKSDSSLTNKIEELDKVSSILHKNAFQNLVNWDESEDKEKMAKKVWVISHSLGWLTKEKTFELLDDCRINRDHEYHFIVLNKDRADDAINRVIRYKREYRESKTDCEESTLHAKERFFILYDLNNKISVPVPSDTVLYIDSEDKIELVINTVEFNDNQEEITDEVKRRNFDLIFKDKRQCQRVYDWFKNEWKRLLQEWKDSNLE